MSSFIVKQVNRQLCDWNTAGSVQCMTNWGACAGAADGLYGDANNCYAMYIWSPAQESGKHWSARVVSGSYGLFLYNDTLAFSVRCVKVLG